MRTNRQTNEQTTNAKELLKMFHDNPEYVEDFKINFINIIKNVFDDKFNLTYNTKDEEENKNTTLLNLINILKALNINPIRYENTENKTEVYRSFIQIFDDCSNYAPYDIYNLLFNLNDINLLCENIFYLINSYKLDIVLKYGYFDPFEVHNLILNRNYLNKCFNVNYKNTVEFVNNATTYTYLNYILYFKYLIKYNFKIMFANNQQYDIIKINRLIKNNLLNDYETYKKLNNMKIKDIEADINYYIDYINNIYQINNKYMFMPYATIKNEANTIFNYLCILILNDNNKKIINKCIEILTKIDYFKLNNINIDDILNLNANIFKNLKKSNGRNLRQIALKPLFYVLLINNITNINIFNIIIDNNKPMSLTL